MTVQLHSALRTLRRMALATLPLGLIAGCGGGESEDIVAGPTMVSVDAPPATPAGSTSTGTASSGTLNYRVWGSGDVAAGTGTTSSALVVATPTSTTLDTTITFDRSTTFPSGLQITKASTSVHWSIQDGGGTWSSVDLAPTGTFGIIKSGGVTSPGDWILGEGLLAKGNFFVLCAARPASTDVTSSQARTGAQVAVSGNFQPMNNLAPLYGKYFYRYDCAGASGKTTFGDGKGHLTMSFDGMNLSEAQTMQAFSRDGYQTASGQFIKRRAYSMVINGVTRYVVVALDNTTTTYASLLYQME